MGGQEIGGVIFVKSHQTLDSYRTPRSDYYNSEPISTYWNRTDRLFSLKILFPDAGKVTESMLDHLWRRIVTAQRMVYQVRQDRDVRFLSFDGFSRDFPREKIVDLKWLQNRRDEGGELTYLLLYFSGEDRNLFVENLLNLLDMPSGEFDLLYSRFNLKF